LAGILGDPRESLNVGAAIGRLEEEGWRLKAEGGRWRAGGGRRKEEGLGLEEEGGQLANCGWAARDGVMEHGARGNACGASFWSRLPLVAGSRHTFEKREVRRFV
jgi:hypothetical protein